MDDRLEALARDEADASTARKAIWPHLATVDGCRAAYGALCRWTWRAMVEHRLDEDLRAWHRLLLDVAARMVSLPPEAAPARRVRLEPRDAAAGVRALADLVRLSVEAAGASDLKALKGRAHVKDVLKLLAREPSDALARESIKSALGLGNANLSRVLTLLAMNGLIERQAQGKAATFRITAKGLGVVEGDQSLASRTKRKRRPGPFAVANIEDMVKVVYSTRVKTVIPGGLLEARGARLDGATAKDHTRTLARKPPSLAAITFSQPVSAAEQAPNTIHFTEAAP